MDLFTRNSPYYHLLKYLLFLLKRPEYATTYTVLRNSYTVQGIPIAVLKKNSVATSAKAFRFVLYPDK